MKNSLLTCAAAAVLGGALSAQPTLQNNVLPAFGDVVTQTEADTAGIAPGPAGANQTWDFSALTPVPGDHEVESTFAPAAGTPFADQFPGANACAIVPGVGGTAYAYFKLENNQISFYGSAADGIALVFSDPELNLSTPLDYHQPFNDAYESVLGDPGGSAIFTRAIKAAEYDAYGTLKMPGAVYPNAMRLKSASVSVDSFAFEDGGYSLTVLNTTAYEWYVAGRPGPQVSVSYSSGQSKTVIPGLPLFEDEIPLSKSVNFVTNSVSSGTQTPEQRLGLRIESLGPNPAVETITLRFTAEKPAATLQLLVRNAAGQTLQTQVLTPAAGENMLTLSVAQLPAGPYFLSLTDGQAVKTLAWVKL